MHYLSINFSVIKGVSKLLIQKTEPITWSCYEGQFYLLLSRKDTSIRKVGLWPQALSEQADAQSGPQVSR